MTDNQINKLPKNWALKTLGEVCKIVYGKGLSTSQLLDSGYPVFGANGIIGFYDKYLYEEVQVLISCRGAYSGKINLSTDKCYITNNSLILGILDKSVVNKQYLFYVLQTANKDTLVTGSAQPQVTINNADLLQIPLPPLLEQQKIVQKIESLFTELETGTKALKTALTQLKIYRQAVLNHFVDLNNEDFEIVNLGEITKKIQIGPFGTQLHKHDYISDGIPLINPTHLKKQKIEPDFNLTVSKEKYLELKNYYLIEGDTIMGRRGEMARCALVTKKEENWLCGTGSLYIRPNMKLSNPSYLFLSLCSQKTKTYLENESSGSTMSNLNLKILKNLQIPLPPLKIQTQIVSEIEKRMAGADILEASLKAQLINAENLRQSILKRAFEGKLV